MKFYFVYALFSKRDFKFSIGVSERVERRFLDHQYGKNFSTRYRRPLELIFYEAYLVKSDAFRRERYFKTSKGKTVLRQLVRDHLDQFSGRGSFAQRATTLWVAVHLRQGFGGLY